MEMRQRLWTLAVILALACGVCAQPVQPNQVTPRQEAQLKAAQDMMDLAEKSRAKKDYTLAEEQCREAIRLTIEGGWPAQRKTFVLGAILYERGDKKIGFKTMLKGFATFSFGAEDELFLARAALDLKEWETARKVVQGFHDETIPNAGLASGTQKYWPEAKTHKQIAAAIDFLEGSRLGERAETRKQALPCLMRADRACPKNVAICHALSKVLIEEKEYRAAVPYLKLVADKADGPVRTFAQIWLAKLS